MKKILLGAITLAASMYCSAETKQALTLHTNSGGQIVYYLEQEPAISFEGQSMIVKVGAEASNIPMEQVNRWEISMAEVSGIGQIKQAEGTVSVYGNTVIVSNPESEPVNVYNVNGQKVASEQNAEANFTLSKGIYVITAGNKTYKIAIR